MFNNTAKNMLDVFLGNTTAPSGTLKVALMDGYTFDETHAFWSDVSASETSATGYTAGGQALDNVTTTQTDPNNGAYIDHDDEAFTGLTGTAGGAMYYFDTGTPSTSLLVGYKVFSDGEQTVANGTITVTPPATGFFLLNRP